MRRYFVVARRIADIPPGDARSQFFAYCMFCGEDIEYVGPHPLHAELCCEPCNRNHGSPTPCSA
jgi:hypothetical protein